MRPDQLLRLRELQRDLQEARFNTRGNILLGDDLEALLKEYTSAAVETKTKNGESTLRLKKR